MQIEINPPISADKINTGVRYVQHAEKERFFETDKEIKHEKFASQIFSR